jgi:hypothetical protein
VGIPAWPRHDPGEDLIFDFHPDGSAGAIFPKNAAVNGGQKLRPAAAWTAGTAERSRHFVNLDWSIQIRHDISASTSWFHGRRAAGAAGVRPRKHF